MYRKIIFALLLMPFWAWSAVPSAVNDTTPEELLRLGLNYLRGNDSLGIYMNKEKGIELIRRAAEQGYVESQFDLGFLNYTIKKDYKQAAYWYRKAAEQGHATAQYGLALCYENGRGVKRDKKQAEYWKKQAAQNGFKLRKER